MVETENQYSAISGKGWAIGWAIENPYLPEEYRLKLNEISLNNPNKYRKLVLGEWNESA